MDSPNYQRSSKNFNLCRVFHYIAIVFGVLAFLMQVIGEVLRLFGKSLRFTAKTIVLLIPEPYFLALKDWREKNMID